MVREFDAIVFGASGFTGQFVVDEMAISMETESLYKHNHIKWAISGRNREKLSKVINDSAERTKIHWVAQVPIIEANTDDYGSLLEMCKRTRLVITVVGPYRFFGEPLVKAAIEAGTDYVDISGEPQFLEDMQLKYYEAAKQSGVYIVSASGWDSIPADLGTTWTKQQFQGDLNGVEIIVSAKSPDGAKMNFGTWHSAIYGYAMAHELGPIRKKLYQEILPLPSSRTSFKMSRRSPLSYMEEIKGRCLPFPGCDRTVVKRSELLKYNTKKERPVECETYFRVNSIFSGLMVIMVASVFGALAKFSFGRYLLERYPGFFSFGVVSKDGVPRSMLEKCSSMHTIIGYGWDEKIDDVDRQHDKPPSKKIITRISGPDPGYTATAMYLVHSGMTLLFDRQKLPSPGVITPGACFQDTYLIDRLTKRGIKFEVVEKF